MKRDFCAFPDLKIACSMEAKKKLTRLAHRTDPEVLTVLEEGTDYTVTYKNNVYPYTLSPGDDGFDSAKAPKVTICGTGSFCGRAEHCFTIGGQAQPSYTVRFDTNGGTAIGDKNRRKMDGSRAGKHRISQKSRVLFRRMDVRRDGRSCGNDLCRPLQETRAFNPSRSPPCGRPPGIPGARSALTSATHGRDF